MSTPNLTPEQIEFQQHARAWLEANPAPEPEIKLPLSQLTNRGSCLFKLPFLQVQNIPKTAITTMSGKFY